MKFFALILLSALATLSARADSPAVAIVTGSSPSALEKHAAEELTGLLKTLFQADAKVAEEIPGGHKNVILLGNPDSNPAIQSSEWPDDLTDQGQVLKSTARGLILGGGSPVATLWAVYEFGHSFGMRYLLHEDFPPVDLPEFSLDGFDSVLQPAVKIRAWSATGAGAASQESWGLAEHQLLLKQLAKLKFNAITLASHDGELWNGEEFPVSGETAGRSVFEGARTFENPDFAGKETVEERNKAAATLTKGIRAAAGELGISVRLQDGEEEESDLTTISLSQEQGGLLPQFSTSILPEKLAKAAKSNGYALQCWIPGDLNASVYFLSRASFDSTSTPSGALESLVTPICGEDVAERLANGFAAIEAVDQLIGKEDPGFAVPDPKMFMEHYESGEPAPEWFAKAKEHYGTAVNEMYRGNTRARGGARPFILYHAKRFTFALHYMTAIEHARLAGVARMEKDEEAWVENLELSVEAMHNALGIYAEVARDNSDRGTIAVLNKYVYRPLLEALDEAPLP